jgi:hypothetical protein
MEEDVFPAVARYEPEPLCRVEKFYRSLCHFNPSET